MVSTEMPRPRLASVFQPQVERFYLSQVVLKIFSRTHYRQPYILAGAFPRVSVNKCYLILRDAGAWVELDWLRASMPLSQNNV